MNGAYRDLRQYLAMLAKFYLSKNTKESLYVIYVMLIWLPQQGFQQPEAECKNVAYIPERVFSDPSYCYCGLLKACPGDVKCCFCGDPIIKFIEHSVKDGNTAPQPL